MIGNTFVPLPQIIDDESLPDVRASRQDSNVMTRFYGFVQSCILFDYFTDIMNDIYQSDQPASTLRADDLLNKATDINHRLDLFAESLPLQMQPSQQQSQVNLLPGFIRLQQLVLSRR